MPNNYDGFYDNGGHDRLRALEQGLTLEVLEFSIHGNPESGSFDNAVYDVIHPWNGTMDEFKAFILESVFPDAYGKGVTVFDAYLILDHVPSVIYRVMWSGPSSLDGLSEHLFERLECGGAKSVTAVMVAALAEAI
jgi:hypothetical protein